ncbi:hypothetical protein [Dyadobacter psychrotolerans]|uniref:Uncharacterized protein n=1 Tax=Dyadobacter psychrotolerans TaxID=2541721 RepID=A0A4R5DDF8_9BACT|nr:hypothetical protein [Dyadobacter psychrotolerans]TDE08303.1 hypothetical protein E0F88_32910 [Dyadobacter psychrotolerans]
MSDNQSNASELADLHEVIQKLTEQAQNEQSPASEGKAKFKLNDKQKALAVLGTVLLGGTAFVAVDQVNGQVVQPAVTPADSTQVHVGENAGVDRSSLAQQIGVGETRPVTGGTITPNEDVQIASSVNDSMSFADAFAAAREEAGPGAIFTWHGTTYNTFFKEEWNQIGLADKQEFLNNIGYKIEGPDKVDQNEIPHNDVVPHDTDEPAPDKADSKTDWASADVKEVVIDGKLTYVFDSDKDGIADAIMIFDEQTNQTTILMDETGDNSLDTIVLMDSNMEPITTQPMEKPALVMMADVDLINESSEVANEEIAVDTLEAEVEEELEGEDSEDKVTLSGDYSNDDDVDDIS